VNVPRIWAVTDLDHCRDLWRRAFPDECFGDLWEVRACFQKNFGRPALFLVAEDASGVRGLLPLSWIEESGVYGYFPGETWQGRTWLEGNRIIAGPDCPVQDLLERLEPGRYDLRYLDPDAGLHFQNPVVDETGFLYRPGDCDYDLNNFLQQFSAKSRKNFRRDLARLERMGVTVRHDRLEDFDLMVALNRKVFGDYSYFDDPRFRAGFRSLALLLHERGWLRLTTIIIAGEPAAVDMGCVYRGVYTVLAGGTNPAYPGVAKMINFNHLEFACRERLDLVDFLCGDFQWKAKFHLTPRDLYLASNVPAVSAAATGLARDEAHA
jgi:hypothetical protein